MLNEEDDEIWCFWDENGNWSYPFSKYITARIELVNEVTNCTLKLSKQKLKTWLSYMVFN
jgi:hypothetical protein